MSQIDDAINESRQEIHVLNIIRKFFEESADRIPKIYYGEYIINDDTRNLCLFLKDNAEKSIKKIKKDRIKNVTNR